MSDSDSTPLAVQTTHQELLLLAEILGALSETASWFSLRVAEAIVETGKRPGALRIEDLVEIIQNTDREPSA